MSIPSELKQEVVSVELVKEAQKYISQHYKEIIEPIEQQALLDITVPQELKTKTTSKGRNYGSSWWLQWRVLMIRGFKARRHEYLSWLRIVQVIASSLIVGSLWFHSKSSTEKYLIDQIGLLFFMSTFWAFFPLFTAIFTFPQERAILAKERASDMYRLSAYFMAHTLTDIFLELGLPILFLCIVYFMASLRLSFEPFFLILLVLFLSIINAHGLGITIGAAVMDIKKATCLASVILLSFMLAGGFFIEKLPVFILWIRYIAFNSYTFKLIVKIQYPKEQLYNCQTSTGCEPIALSPALHGISLGGGGIEVAVLLSMAIFYHLLAYAFLSHEKRLAG